jgi:hypothetical protein
VPLLFASDLPSSVKSLVDDETLDVMVTGVSATAARVAPCLSDPANVDARAEATLILVGAVKRWAEAGSGAIQTRQSGPFSQTIDTRQRTGYNLWPSEIAQLEAICASVTATSSRTKVGWLA